MVSLASPVAGADAGQRRNFRHGGDVWVQLVCAVHGPRHRGALEYHGGAEVRCALAITLDLARRVTDAELRTFSERNPGYQFERTAKGDLVVSPTGSESGRLTAQVLFQLETWNRRVGRGVTFDSSTGWNLADGSCLSPDASWVRRDRWESLPKDARDTYAPLCPDAVFEVRSPSNSLRELRAKMLAYVQNGAGLAVLVDPLARSVEVFRPNCPVQSFEGVDTVALDPEMPRFVLDLQSLWSD